MGTHGTISSEKWVLWGMWLSQPTWDDLSPKLHASQGGPEDPGPGRGGKELRRQHNTASPGQPSIIWGGNHGGDDAQLLNPLSALPRHLSPPQTPPSQIL